MKRNKYLALMASCALMSGLVACNLLPGKVVDGPGMEQNIWETGEADPVKNPTDTDNQDGNDDTDGSDTTVTEEMDDETIYASFINNEYSAEFDHIIGNTKEEYTLQEMIDAQAEECFREYLYYDDSIDYIYETNNYSAIIDCGDDGVKELGLWIEFSIKTTEDYQTTINKIYVFKNFDGQLKCLTSQEGQYRTWVSLNEYGVFKYEGSGGAALYCCEYSFINAKGDEVFDYSCNTHFALTEPMAPIYELPSELRSDPDIYEEEFSVENEYSVDVYNFTKYPEYPRDLKYDEDGNFDSASQKKYDKYNQKCEEYANNNLFTFMDANGNYAEPRGKIKDFLDEKGVHYYTNKEMNDIVSAHESDLGLTKKMKDGKEASWVCFSNGITEKTAPVTYENNYEIDPEYEEY